MHEPYIPQGGKISPLNLNCCIGKTILGGIYDQKPHGKGW